MDSDRPWTGDVNEAVVEEWKAETSPFDRVREVLQSTTRFQYAGTIAERARVSEPSARKHLQTLADGGFADALEIGQGTRFRRSRESIAIRRIGELHSELSRDELVSGIRDLKSRIGTYRDRYDVTDPDDLALELDPEDDDWAVIPEWRALEEDLDLAQAALSLYDFDPDGPDEAPARDRQNPDGHDEARADDRQSRGSFADDTGGLSV